MISAIAAFPINYYMLLSNIKLMLIKRVAQPIKPLFTFINICQILYQQVRKTFWSMYNAFLFETE